MNFARARWPAVARSQNLACLPLLLASATANEYRKIAKYPWTTEFLPGQQCHERPRVKGHPGLVPGQKEITVDVAEDQTGSGAAYSRARTRQRSRATGRRKNEERRPLSLIPRPRLRSP